MTEEQEIISYSFTSSTESHQLAQEPDILFPLSENRKGYENDESCKNCDRKFNITGLAVSKKFICNFCYRGVCQICIPHKCFHSETKRREKMCSACHHQLLVLSSDFNNHLQAYRLERAGLMKEVSLAIKEREILIKERQITEERLKSVKETLENMSGGKLNQLEHERTINKDLLDRVKEMTSQSKICHEKLLLLQKKLSDKKNRLASLKEKREQEKILNQEISQEIDRLRVSCSHMKAVKYDEVCVEEEIIEKIVTLNEEIQDIQEKLVEKKTLKSDAHQLRNELLNQIKSNDETLASINKKFLNLKSNPETFSEQEKEILEQLRNQIKQQDDLISITKAQTQNRCSRMSLRSSLNPGKTSGRYFVSSELLQSANSSQYSIVPDDQNPASDQRRCQNCLLL